MLPHASLGQPRGQKPHRPLKLPKTTEEWAEADHLLAQVTPVVTACVLGEDKSNILASQIYHILSERFGTRSLPRSRKRSQGQLRLHNRALKKVTFLKNAARQDLRKAQREESKESIRSCTGQFLSLLRDHSKAKRLAGGQLVKLEARAARDDCHKLWRFAKDLLDNNRATSISPTFSSQEAYNFFSKQYTTEPHDYSTPPWMPPSADPKYAMYSVDSITMGRAIRGNQTIPVNISPFPSRPSSLPGV